MKSCLTKQVWVCALGVIFLMLIATGVMAQEKNKTNISPEAMSWMISTMVPWPEDKYKSVKEAMIDNQFFIPLVFRGGLFSEIDYVFCRDSIRLKAGPPPLFPYKYKFQSDPLLFSHFQFRKSINDLIYKEVMLKNPRFFKYTYLDLPTKTVKAESIEVSKDKVTIEVKSTNPPPKGTDPFVLFKPKRRYWSSTFGATINFMYNKTTPNWPKGQIDNMTILTNTTTSLNYARNNIALTNSLSIKFGIVNAPKDTLRSYTIGEDELRFSSNFQLKAIRKWNYSLTNDFVTPMGNKYAVNKDIKNSAFLAPFTFTAGLGMTYNLKPKFKAKERLYELTVVPNPLSFTYKHSISRDINLAPHFKEKDKDGNIIPSFHAFGSQLKITQNFNYNNNCKFTSRFDYFSNFEFARIEFENRLLITLNRFFSIDTKLYIRFEDNVKKVEGHDSYWQTNRYFLFGITYNR